MSTASTIIIKKPVAGYPSNFSHLKEYSTNLIAICLWGIAAIVTAANMNISPNATGISVSIKTQDVILMLAMTYLLGKGLRESNYLLVIPWIVLSFWNMYHVHYGSLIKMGYVLLEKGSIAKLPWIALSMDFLGLGCVDCTDLPKLHFVSQSLPGLPCSILSASDIILDACKGLFKLKNNQEYDLLVVEYDANMETTETEDETGWNCSVHPSVFFLLGTLVLTTCATAMLCGAIMTDHWEEVTWDREDLKSLANNTVKLQWTLDNAVVRVSTNDERDAVRAFLVPMHGGIWTLCISLSDEEIRLLETIGFPSVIPCVNYLSGGTDGMKGYEPRADWQHRMQNLSISCALVCLIILGSAALVGAFGVCQHQISAVLVTGVMYLLAASFALFTLTIIHFKRVQSKPRLDMDTDGTADGVFIPPGGKIPVNLLSARIFTTSWSLDLGWGGVVLTVMTSILWILLSKIMRFNPISTMIN